MEIISTQIKNGEVKRADLNITTSGSSVIAKLLQGSGISLTSTGADAGTGDVTISATGTTFAMGVIGSVPNANGATISGAVLNLQPASTSFGGVVTTGTQSFAGDKTINGAFLATIGATTLNVNATNIQFNTLFAGGLNTKFTLSGNTSRWEANEALSSGIIDVTPYLIDLNTPDLKMSFLSPVTTTNVLYYNTTTKSVTYGGVPTGGSGITRSILSISVATTGAVLANTDYVYLASGTFTFTLPSAVGNTNRYTLKVTGAGTITLATTGGQTVDNVTPGLVTFPTSLDFVSNNSNWFII